MKPLIITAALTGGGPPRQRTPHLPITPVEIAREAVDAWRAGAAIVHIHGRTLDGTPTAEVSIHKEILDRIRQADSDVIVNFSAGDGGGRFTHDERLVLIDAGAEMVSFTASSYNTGRRLYNNAPSYLDAACKRMQQVDVRPEIEVLDLGFIDHVARLRATEALREPLYCLLGFGIPGAMPADPALLPLIIRRLPDDTEWGVACAAEPGVALRMLMHAFLNDGHVRIGMEDQPYLKDGELATSNAQLVEQWTRTAAIWGRPVATSYEARRTLGLLNKPCPD